jgi:hypothetical protein
MKRVLQTVLITLALLSTANPSIAQTAGSVLENGIHIKPNEKIYFQYKDGKLRYDAAKSVQDASNLPDFITFKDSSIFLVQRSVTNIYAKPLNPLSFSFTTTNKEVLDPINAAAATASSSIIDIVKLATSSELENAAVTNSVDTCNGFHHIEVAIKLIESKLNNNNKENISKIFTSLKVMPFLNQESTRTGLLKAEKEIEPIKEYYNGIETSINEYNCDQTSSYLIKNLFSIILTNLNKVKDEQIKRLNNLNTAFALSNKAYTDAAASDWLVELNEIPSNQGKISLFTISIKKSGYNLSDSGEIVDTETSEILKRTIIVRRFQRFIPEVSAGVAYTFFKYNTYGTISDSTGQQYVASPTENSIRNLNIATVINFNYFIANSNINPLYQIGAGISAGIPTIITGLGIRSNINGFKRLVISGGIAMTWIKQLETLNPKDKVAGTSDIEKDLKYKFTFPPKPYIGLQYTF